MLERDTKGLTRLQNIFGECGFLGEVLVLLLKRLIYKEASYK
jgi:hypothetical protein